MSKLIYILLLIGLTAQAQDLELKDRTPSAWRMVATNITAVTLDAVGDGLRDESWVTHNPQQAQYGHALQAMSTGILLTIPLGQDFTTRDWLTHTVTYILTRVAIFDPVYNLTRGLPIHYTGGSSMWDKALGTINPPDGFLFARGVTLTVAISIPLQDFRK